MSCIDDFPLGDIPLDSAQTIRKAWDDSKKGHRVVPVKDKYNCLFFTYDSDGNLTLAEYFDDNCPEKSKATFTGDCSGDLDGKHISLFSAKNVAEYRIWYTVDCGTCAPSNSGIIQYIQVCIKSCDVNEVVAKATELVLLTNCNFIAHFTFKLFGGGIITFDTNTNGITTDISDSCTGFCLEVTQQGSRVLTESLTYTYDCCCNICKIITNSGENIFDSHLVVKVSGIVNTKISSGDNTVDVNEYGELAVELAPTQEELLKKIVTELKIMNTHLSMVTDVEIRKQDLDGEDII